jgi:hypothetical protein
MVIQRKWLSREGWSDLLHLNCQLFVRPSDLKGRILPEDRIYCRCSREMDSEHASESLEDAPYPAAGSVYREGQPNRPRARDTLPSPPDPHLPCGHPPC